MDCVDLPDASTFAMNSKPAAEQFSLFQQCTLRRLNGIGRLFAFSVERLFKRYFIRFHMQAVLFKMISKS